MQEYIYNSQTAFTIIADTEKDLTAFTDISIHWRDPRGLQGLFVAEFENQTSGLIKYNWDSVRLYGNWTMWAVAIDSTGLRSVGDKFYLNILEE
jgi:hypothetical protein